MTAPDSFPGPASNWTSAGFGDRTADIASTDVLFAAGDFTGGASEDLFTLAAHGLISGDVVHVLWQSAMGAVTGGEGTRAVVKYLSASTFQLTTDGTTIIENTADGNVVLLKGRIPTGVVKCMVIPRVIVAAGDFTGGAAEDIFTPAQGTKGLFEADQIKLVYKSAAGVVLGAVDVTYYAKTVTVTTFLTSTSAGGAVQENTADGTAVFLKVN
jgi:hypothetical protein